MHELAFAEQILTAVAREASQYPDAKVTRIRLSAGKYLGLDRASLTFCLEAISQGTLIEGARIDLVELGPEFECPACGRVALENDTAVTCPKCGAEGAASPGTELFIEEIELDDENGQD